MEVGACCFGFLVRRLRSMRVLRPGSSTQGGCAQRFIECGPGGPGSRRRIQQHKRRDGHANVPGGGLAQPVVIKARGTFGNICLDFFSWGAVVDRAAELFQ